MSERERINEIILSLPENVRMFRINAGMGFSGSVVRHDRDMVLLRDPRVFHGAPSGWPDLVGWETVEITPEMVGRKIAVFSAIEVKVTGRMSKEQKAFREVLLDMGGRHTVDRPLKSA